MFEANDKYYLLQFRPPNNITLILVQVRSHDPNCKRVDLIAFSHVFSFIDIIKRNKLLIMHIFLFLSGVPAVVDFAAMRDAVKRLGGDPSRINPLCPVDLVIDHSVQVDVSRRYITSRVFVWVLENLSVTVSLTKVS